jgi:hypothetical protein
VDFVGFRRWAALDPFNISPSFHWNARVFLLLLL